MKNKIELKTRRVLSIGEGYALNTLDAKFNLLLVLFYQPNYSPNR